MPGNMNLDSSAKQKASKMNPGFMIFKSLVNFKSGFSGFFCGLTHNIGTLWIGNAEKERKVSLTNWATLSSFLLPPAWSHPNTELLMQEPCPIGDPWIIIGD